MRTAMPDDTHPAEIAAYALILAKDAGDETAVKRLRELAADPDALREALADPGPEERGTAGDDVTDDDGAGGDATGPGRAG